MEELQKKLGYTFKDPEKLIHALRHSSYANEQHMKKEDSNERLEFLGDAVLELVSSEYLYQTYPEEPEGHMTKMRAACVCEKALAYCARDIDLGEKLFLGKGAEAGGGRNRDSVTSDALEAVFGAVYLDGGFEAAKSVIRRIVLKDLEDKCLFYDSKTVLQEMVQGAGKGNVSYRLKNATGPDHRRVFEMEVLLGEDVLGTGTGSSKKQAEMSAAYKAIRKISNKQ